MAYENGDLIKDYLGDCLKRYDEDNNIVEKTINLFKAYQKRTDWPYCIDELDKATREVLGTDLINITFGVGKYLYDDKMNWEGVSNNLKRDLRYLYNLTSSAYNQAWFARYNPNGFYGIAHSITRDNKISLRIVKNNSEYIEVEENITGLKEIIYSLENIINKVEKENE